MFPIERFFVPKLFDFIEFFLYFSLVLSDFYNIRDFLGVFVQV